MTLGISHRIITSVAAIAAICSPSLVLQSCLGSGSGTLEVDSLVYERSWTLKEAMDNDPLGGRSHFYVKVDYPVLTDEAKDNFLADSVKAWISGQLLPEEGRRVMSKKVLDVAADIFFGETDGNEWGEEVSYTLQKIYEDKDFLSYEANHFSYNGGAHGSYNVGGVTFRKKDGSHVTWSDIDTSDELRKKLTEELRRTKGSPDEESFKASIMADEKDCLLADGTFALPLPITTPWLTDQGWAFTYQPYEILPWCHGAPACCIKDIKVK